MLLSAGLRRRRPPPDGRHQQQAQSLDVIATDAWIMWGHGIGGHPHTGTPPNRPPRRSPETVRAYRETVASCLLSSTLRRCLLDGLEVVSG